MDDEQIEQEQMNRDQSVDTNWQAIGASVIGASHVRSELPNQDSLGIWFDSEYGGQSVIVAVADGHGSAKSFRSNRGSELAVETAQEVLQRLVTDNISHSEIRTYAKTTLRQHVARNWRGRVDNDVALNPFSEEELSLLEQKEGIAVRERVAAKPVVAYGSTLLAVLATQDYCIYMQIGDGDILCVAEDGAVTRPIPADSRLFANETTSLSADNAWQDVRVEFSWGAENRPYLITLSSDGYANSFQDDAAFKQVATDLLDTIGKHGVNRITDNLSEWLTTASSLGSGDDVTLGLLYRDGSSTTPRGTPESEPSECESSQVDAAVLMDDGREV